jgi:3-oxoacyl-[acyl-carrier protein] reductase
MGLSVDLRNRAAIVTGGGRGLGRAIAVCLAEAGANVAINYPPFEMSPDAVVAEIDARGVGGCAVIGDVTRPADAEEMVRAVLDRFGRIDILVNNAGIMNEVPITELSYEAWDETIRVDLYGVFVCTQAVLPHMVSARRGVIINVASQLAYSGGVRLAHYAAAKAGVVAFTKSLARELAPLGIRVNAIAPGPIETDMTRKLATPEWRKAKERSVVMGRFAQPEEIGPTVAFLASDLASYYTGQTLLPNGGGIML